MWSPSSFCQKKPEIKIDCTGHCVESMQLTLLALKCVYKKLFIRFFDNFQNPECADDAMVHYGTTAILSTTNH